MTVSEARALAARWVAEHAASTPGFAGALLGGSVAWSPAHAELPATSDVDVMVVTDDPGAAPGPWPRPRSPSPPTSPRRPGRSPSTAAATWSIGATTARRSSGSPPPTRAAWPSWPSDAPAAAPGHTPGFQELLGDLGVASPADLVRRAAEVRGFLPRLGRVAEAILAANPDARD